MAIISFVQGGVEKKFDLKAREELVLMVLYGTELYSLELCKAVEEAYRGNRNITLGTMYSVLIGLEKKGLVQSRWGDDEERLLEERGGARRRYYRLTEDGETVFRTLRSIQESLINWKSPQKGSSPVREAN